MRQFLRNLVRRIVGISVSRKTTSIRLGKSVILDPNLVINAGHLSIGDYSYAGPGRISSLPETRVEIGKYTSIAAGVQIIGALHKSHITTYGFNRLLPPAERMQIQHGITRGDIIIGNDVWIGANAIILSGVTIGDGAIIGAGAVVTKDVPSYAVAVGVPARIKKFRFPPEEIAMLQEVRWWDWDFDKLRRIVPMFYDESLSVATIFERAKKIST